MYGSCSPLIMNQLFLSAFTPKCSCRLNADHWESSVSPFPWWEPSVWFSPPVISPSSRWFPTHITGCNLSVCLYRQLNIWTAELSEGWRAGNFFDPSAILYHPFFFHSHLSIHINKYIYFCSYFIVPISLFLLSSPCCLFGWYPLTPPPPLLTPAFLVSKVSLVRCSHNLCCCCCCRCCEGVSDARVVHGGKGSSRAWLEHTPWEVPFITPATNEVHTE